VAEVYSVSHVTVGNWKKKRRKTEKWCSARVSNEDLKERKTMNRKRYVKLLFIG
jgi:hypothetical protein